MNEGTVLQLVFQNSIKQKLAATVGCLTRSGNRHTILTVEKSRSKNGELSGGLHAKSPCRVSVNGCDEGAFHDFRLRQIVLMQRKLSVLSVARPVAI